jgi:hypothetical protein
MSVLAGAETIAANRYILARVAPVVAPAKVFPGVASQGSSMPYVIYQYMPRPGGSDTTALGGTRVLVRLRYLIKVVSASLSATEPLVKALDQALQDTEGPQSGYYVSNVQRLEPFEMPTVEDGELYWQVGGYYELDVSAGI